MMLGIGSMDKMTCEICGQMQCVRRCPYFEESSNVIGVSEGERYEAWKAKMILKLEKFNLEYPSGGSYLAHFTRYSRRY